MKKIISSIVIMFVSVILFTGVYASGPVWLNPDNVPAGTYVIGTHAFDRNRSDIYDGTLTVKHIMLAAQTIEGDSIEDMNVYYKRARDGAWVDAITNEVVDAPNTNFEYYNGKEITVNGNGLWDVLGLPDVSFKQVVATEQVEHNKRKYVFEVASVNCDEYEVYYKSAGETEYTKMDNINVVRDENNLSVIEIVVPGNFEWMEHCDIKIRGLNTYNGVYSNFCVMNAEEHKNPKIRVSHVVDTSRVGGTLMQGTQLYVSNDNGKTYTPVAWTSSYPHEDSTASYDYEFDNNEYNSYWFKAAYTKITSTGTYTSYSRVVKYEEDISDLKILSDKKIFEEDGIKYREITAQITGNLEQYNNEDSWCYMYIKPNGTNEYFSLNFRTRLYNVQQIGDDQYTANITINIPNYRYGTNIDINNSMMIKVFCESLINKTDERKSFVKTAELDEIQKIPEMKIDQYNQLYIECEQDTNKVYLEQSIDGGEFVEVDPDLIIKTGTWGTLFETVYDFLDNVGTDFNKISFRAKNIKLDSQGNEVASEYSKVVTYVVNGDMSNKDITAILVRPNNVDDVVVHCKYSVEIEQKEGDSYFQVIDKTKYTEGTYGEQGDPITRCPIDIKSGIIYEYRARIVVAKGNEIIYSDYCQPAKVEPTPVLEIFSTYSSHVGLDTRQLQVVVTGGFKLYIIEYKFEGETEWNECAGYETFQVDGEPQKLQLIADLPRNDTTCTIRVKGFTESLEESDYVEVVDEIKYPAG